MPKATWFWSVDGLSNNNSGYETFFLGQLNNANKNESL